MEIYDSYSQWEWRFGETPNFTNSLEKKFPWALIDIQFNVSNGKINEGKVFSDCLVPAFIEMLNEELATGEITYDVEGITDLCNRVTKKAEGQETLKQVVDEYIPDLKLWLSDQI